MDAHFERLLRLLELEREAERERNKEELARLPPQQREALGKSATRLSAEPGALAEGGYPLLLLSRQPAGEPLSPFHAMSRGDLVCAESPDGQRLDGTLYEVEPFRASVALNGRLSEPLPGGRWMLHLVGSDATYRRMRRALQDADAAKTKAAARLREVFSGARAAGAEPAPEPAWRDGSLNEFQREAVRRALGARDAALIHGPPGTGKTTTLVELIWQIARDGGRVLASAPSNVATDNLLEKLLEAGLRALRLGHPARTLESLRHATLAARLASHPQARAVRDMRLERERLAVQRERAAARRGDSGLDRERRRRIRELWSQAKDLERSIEREIVDGAQVVVATHAGIPPGMSRRGFDCAVLDEACQATEPLSWIPLLEARKVVLAGDPRQLPPTIYSREAADAGLSVSLFERLERVLPAGLRAGLRVQYRMHQAIMDFPSREFYGGALIADASVRGHLLSGLPGVRKTELSAAPLAFVDTAGSGFEEGWDELTQSRDNPGEADLVATLLSELLAAGLNPREAGVITPYAAQARRLRELLRDSAVEVGTVDGFQGREKEAVLLSLVRSNDKGELGFLEDFRRLNVALTRARRLLVVVGDGATLARHPLYARFIEHAQALDAHRSAWEWASKPAQ